MAKKKTKSPPPGPFSAISNTWSDVSKMQPAIEKLIRWFGVPVTETWPKWVSGGAAFLLGLVGLALRIILGAIQVALSLMGGFFKK